MAILRRESNHIIRFFFGDITKIEMRTRARESKENLKDQHRVGQLLRLYRSWLVAGSNHEAWKGYNCEVDVVKEKEELMGPEDDEYESSTVRKRFCLVLRDAWLSVGEEYPRCNIIYLLAINGTVVLNDEELSDSAQHF